MDERNENVDRTEAEERRIASRKNAKKTKRIVAIVTPIAVVCVLFLIVLTRVIIPNNRYNAAKKRQLDLTNVSVGSTIKFGFYEQDGFSFNGKEEIEWKVLAIADNKALILSLYALDTVPYNDTLTSVTWDQCTLRTWLNRTFYNTAFDADLKEKIIASTVQAHNNPSYSTPPGYNTTDEVFLLSITELNRYFSSDEERKCGTTDYARARGVAVNTYYSVNGKPTCRWWLRSPGERSDSAVSVRNNGSFGPSGNAVNSTSSGIRPAMWIKIDSTNGLYY